ncbi:hypothetical protein AVEN_157515-1 [Araneus ventricosus]|uniref:Peptidase A2 domain-containing protein n=1 Tax=Araneus ventricosus TaxID=182803 RepID=A0A4Y2U324_ARAVE|nr:hypothetical protein AVEN_157515-1 [Araneus ventricosus]
MKKCVPPEVKDHFLDIWCEWVTPDDLIEKLDTNDNLRTSKNETQTSSTEVHKKQTDQQKSNYKRHFYFRGTKIHYEQKSDRQSLSAGPSQSRRDSIKSDRAHRRSTDRFEENGIPLTCYGCGASGVIKAKCRTCNPTTQQDATLSSSLNHMNFYSFSMESNPTSIIEISVCNTRAAVCADTGATHSVAGQKLYQLLKKNGLTFENRIIDMTLADGQIKKNGDTHSDLKQESSRSLKRQWYFSAYPERKYNFIESPPDINALLAVHTASNRCKLRENEGTSLSSQQKVKLNSLLEEYENCFQPGGEATPFIENKIDTGNHLSVAVPLYRLFPARQEILKKEIDALLAAGVIEECDSPYAAPVVLVFASIIANSMQ